MARSVLWTGIVITAMITMGAQPDLRSMLAVTLAALAVVLLATTLSLSASSERIIAVGDRREAPIAPRHCDPDAAGRPRPRAPSKV